MTAPLSGVRVLEYAQYVAGPLCGSLLAELGADVVKIEPPHGDGYRYVMPIAPGLGRYFVPLNRGKRSVILDLKSEEGRRHNAELLAGAEIVVHNFRPEQAHRFGLDWPSVHAARADTVVGVVTSYGPDGPLAGAPAYDLIAQARSGLLTAHAARGDVVPVRTGGIPMADLAAGFLLATGVLAGLVRAREDGVGERVEVSLLAAALAVQLQDLVWLEDEPGAAGAPPATAADLEARAREITDGLALNPYYRSYAAADGYLAVACLNLAQRRSFAEAFELDDPTIEAPDLAPPTAELAARKRALTAGVESAFARRPVEAWLAILEEAGVPCGPILAQRTVEADEQIRANRLVETVEQPGLGTIRMLGRVFGLTGELSPVAPAPALGEHTDEVLAETRS